MGDYEKLVMIPMEKYKVDHKLKGAGKVINSVKADGKADGEAIEPLKADGKAGGSKSNKAVGFKSQKGKGKAKVKNRGGEKKKSIKGQSVRSGKKRKHIANYVEQDRIIEMLIDLI